MNVENVELDDQLSPFEYEEKELESDEGETEFGDELKEAIIERMQQIYNDGMIVGFQTACHTALNKIYTFESSQGKKSANDYKRCIKDLKTFFETGISRTANSDANVESEENTTDETAQN